MLSSRNLPPPLQLSQSEIYGEWYSKTPADLFNAIQPEDGFKWPSFEWRKGNSDGMYLYIVEKFGIYANVRGSGTGSSPARATGVGALGGVGWDGVGGSLHWKLK